MMETDENGPNSWSFSARLLLVIERSWTVGLLSMCSLHILQIKNYIKYLNSSTRQLYSEGSTKEYGTLIWSFRQFKEKQLVRPVYAVSATSDLQKEEYHLHSVVPGVPQPADKTCILTCFSRKRCGFQVFASLLCPVSISPCISLG